MQNTTSGIVSEHLISIKTSTTLGSNAGLNVFMAETRKKVRSCFCPTPRFNPKSYLDHAIQIWIFGKINRVEKKKKKKRGQLAPAGTHRRYSTIRPC